MLRAQASEEIIEADYARADADNAGLRFGSYRAGNGSMFGAFGQGFRRNGPKTLREEGYDGD